MNNNTNNFDKKTQNSSRFNGLKRYWEYGVVAFLVIAASIILFFLIYRQQDFRSVTDKVLIILKPIIYGLVIAYLLNPVVNYFYRKFSFLFGKILKKPVQIHKMAKGCSIFLSLALGISFIIILGMLVIPEVYNSIVRLVNSMPEQVDSFLLWTNKFINRENQFTDITNKLVVQATEYLEKWLKSELIPQSNKVFASVTSGIIEVVKTLWNLIIGIIASIYILGMKDVFIGQFKKLFYALFSPRKANTLITTIRKSHEIFGGFIVGKLIDSLIIGLICFVFLSIFKMPYVVLVSVIIGVTNIIPFFGPYIGAIPSSFLILLVNPVQGIYFIIFILILQQVDGNIIGPKILGDSTGLSPFWVLFSILLFGGIWGFVGMVMGVPTFAVIYYLINQYISYRLRRKNLPINSNSYRNINYMEDNQHIVTLEGSVSNLNDSDSNTQIDNFTESENNLLSQSTKTNDDINNKNNTLD